jgi:hypothetical protein
VATTSVQPLPGFDEFALGIRRDDINKQMRNMPGR